jgi:tRNA(Met) C34 N-acetyltransferase TmcA
MTLIAVPLDMFSQVCYVRQTKNDLTGEHSSIMLRELSANIPDAPTAG